MTDHIPVRVMRYGVDADLPVRRTLRAGPLTAVLENADLRYVMFGDHQIVLRLYMAVRDRNWGTIEPVFTRFEVEDRGDGFRVELEAEHVSGDVDFAWRGVIEGTPDGTIGYRMDGAPRKAFLKNRIGFCVLHPMELAGQPATVETPEGSRDAAFPELISPHQPFIDMVSIRHPAGPNATATIRFEGDLFETEDQRNWTDASYKTYSTPLRLPYPIEVTPETRITQAVTISVTGQPGEAAAGGSTPDVVVNVDGLAPLPPIGFGAGRKPLPEGDALARLRALKPAHLWADLDLAGEGWRERLAVVAGNARAVDAPLDLSVIGGPRGSGWAELAAAIKADGIEIGRLFAFPPVSEPIVFPRSDLATHPETVASADVAFTGADVAAAIGGGTRAYFTELNRATDFLPVDELDVVTYTINPQVHAFDNLSVIETLAAQAETVRSARAIVGDRPLAVGPVTFKPPYNPNATAAPPAPGPDQLPEPVDPRQLSLFGAGWTLGSIYRLASAGVDALTYYELQGWRGVQERTDRLSRRGLFPSIPGQLFPLYHIFAAAADFAGGQ
ncbi:MAG: hypothetical protein IT336_06385, partial [Thermomicrobiales bacterium]|nr:hypothetical protein [Thermomicrobiales bacterium]